MKKWMHNLGVYSSIGGVSFTATQSFIAYRDKAMQTSQQQNTDRMLADIHHTIGDLNRRVDGLNKNTDILKSKLEKFSEKTPVPSVEQSAAEEVVSRASLDYNNTKSGYFQTKEILEKDLDKLTDPSLSSEERVQIATKVKNTMSELYGNLNNAEGLIGKIDSTLEACDNIDNGKSAFFGDYISSFSDLISSLNIEQLIALTNLFFCIFIILILINIMTSIYSGFLIEYFKLSERYPFISGFIRLRGKFQQYYLAWSFFLMVAVTSFVTYFNVWVIFNA